MKFITDIQNTGNESMHSCDINVDYEGVSMYYWNVWLIKINTFNLGTNICTVMCNTFPCIQTVTLHNNMSIEWTKKLFSLLGGTWMGWYKKEGWNFCSFHIAKINLLSGIVSEDPLKLHQCSLGWNVSLGDELQYVKLQIWIDQIWSKYLQDIFSGSSSFCID